MPRASSDADAVAPAGAGDPSPRQQQLLGRIQLAGVLVLVAVQLVGGIFRTLPVLIGSLLVSLLTVVVLGWLAAKVQRRRCRDLARDANRALLDEVTGPVRWMARRVSRHRQP